MVCVLNPRSSAQFLDSPGGPLCGSVAVPMMRIRKMDVHVGQRFVIMEVTVPLIWRHGICMVVRMVRIVVVDVFVRVFDHGVVMFMRMAFAQMQSYPDEHQQATEYQGCGDGFAQQGHGQQSSGKRRHRKIGAGSRRAQVP